MRFLTVQVEKVFVYAETDTFDKQPTEQEWTKIIDDLSESREIKTVVDILQKYDESPVVFCKLFDKCWLSYPQMLYFCKLMGWELMEYGFPIDKRGNVYRETYMGWIVEANIEDVYGKTIHVILDIVQCLSHYVNEIWDYVDKFGYTEVDVIVSGEITQIKVKSVKIINDLTFVVLSSDNKEYYPYNFPLYSLERISSKISVVPFISPFESVQKDINIKKNRIELLPEIAYEEKEKFLNAIF